MSETTSAVALLGTRLCPWLHESLARLDAARSSERLGHAWLIKGPAGIGKLNLALAFAHRLLHGAGDADLPPVLERGLAGPAMSERHLPADRHPDLHWLFPEEDKRTISVEQIRDVSQSLSLKALRGGAKVVIIEPAEAMTTAAANALLKTLEEPPPLTYLLLVSHQPDRLPATVRSRCQSLIVPRPPARAAAEWLGVEDDPRRETMLRMSRRAPLRALEWVGEEEIQFISGLENSIDWVSRNKLDARAVAEEWMKRSPALALQWLVHRLQQSIGARMAPKRSNTVTDLDANPLHNAWQSLTLGALFQRLEAAEKLLEQLGSGLNTELALHVLLLGFQAERGQP